MIAGTRELVDVLFASLWQGACIAFGIAVLLGFAGRRLNAATRCILLQGTLVAVAIVPIVTTLPSVASRTLVRFGYTVSHAPAGKGVARRGGLMTVPRRIDVGLSDRAVALLTCAWFIGVVVLTLRIAGGSLQIARLVRRSHPLGIRGGVAIHASRDVGVPFTIGFVRPLIVVPAALAAEAREEFECIVLHELAHVRRCDAYGNACDRLMQAFFYFNPAVLLILRAIALEREVACDDLAVAQSRDLSTYTCSLASYALRGAHGGCGVARAASGFGRATLTRIRRLEDERRNGATAVSYNAIGGLTLVFFAIALILQTFGPAVAFAAPASLSRATIASTACADSDARYINGPAPERMNRLPNGLRTMVRVQVSSTGKVMGATILKGSGNAGFDRAVIAAAKKGVYAPQTRHCRPLAGSYVFYAMTA